MECSWTEAEIRAAMEHHRPGNEGYCLCAWNALGNDDEARKAREQMFGVDHLIDKLRESKTARVTA